METNVMPQSTPKIEHKLGWDTFKTHLSRFAQYKSYLNMCIVYKVSIKHL